MIIKGVDQRHSGYPSRSAPLLPTFQCHAESRLLMKVEAMQANKAKKPHEKYHSVT
jgi:hypothetical protein